MIGRVTALFLCFLPESIDTRNTAMKISPVVRSVEFKKDELTVLVKYLTMIKASDMDTMDILDMDRARRKIREALTSCEPVNNQVK